LAFLHPPPTVEQLPDGGDWWSPQRREIRRRPALKKIQAKLQSALIGSDLELFVRATTRLAGTGRLLDVGCGDGALLQLASGRLQGCGVEPSPKTAARARERGFEVINETIEQAELPSDHFDVITMYSVIEHLADPVSVVHQLARAARAGGILAVCTPKYRGPTWRLRGAGWNGYRVGYHTFFFTAATLGRVMADAGFEVLRSPRRNRPLDDILILWGRRASLSGRPRRLPARVPHGSGGAEFPHPAPQAHGFAA
jgi:2-polyprenyl-3-methyl-5-hydroxy-6-metoxy-1,4-benzoquinol methylase